MQVMLVIGGGRGDVLQGGVRGGRVGEVLGNTLGSHCGISSPTPADFVMGWRVKAAEVRMGRSEVKPEETLGGDVEFGDVQI